MALLPCLLHHLFRIMPPKASGSGTSGSAPNNAAFLDMLAQQQCQPIARAIDAGNPKQAVELANVLLENGGAQPSHPFARALRAHALVSLRKQADALADVDHVIEKSHKQALYSANVVGVLTSVLERLGQPGRAADLLDEASKAKPADEHLGKKAFESAVAQQDYLRAHQVAARLAKALPAPASSSSAPVCSSIRNRYFWWSMQAYLMLATETPQAQGAALALTLAERMIDKHLATKEGSFDEKSDQDVQLYVSILLAQAEKSEGKPEKRRQALDVLSKEPGRIICARSLGLGQLKRDLLRDCEQWAELRGETRKLMEGGDGNWMTVEKWVEAEVRLAPAGEEGSEKEGMAFLKPFLDKSGKTRREYPLAAIALRHELRKAGKAVSGDSGKPLADYVATFGRKLCCYEDLLPYIDALDPQEAKKVLDSLPEALPSSFSSEDDVIRAVNATKLQHRLRGVLNDSGAAASSPSEVHSLLRTFYLTLPSPSKIPKTVPRPGSDFVLLASQLALSNTSSSPPSPNLLIHLISLLNHTAQASPASYPLKLLQLRLYLLLDCPTLARACWKDLKIRSVQNESLAWLWAEHGVVDYDEGDLAGGGIGGSGGSSSASPVGDWRRETQGLYNEFEGEFPKLISTAMTRGNYASVTQFAEVARRMRGSGHKAALRLAQAKIDAQRQWRSDSGDGDEEDGGWQSAQAALHDVGKMVREGLHDQADRSVLPSFAAKEVPSLAVLSSKKEGSKYGADDGKAVNSNGDSTSASRCPPAIGLHAQYLSAWYGEDKVELPESLRISSTAELDEDDALFSSCISALATAGTSSPDEQLRAFASHVESVVSEAATLPWRQNQLVSRLVDIYLLARHRASSNEALSGAATTILVPTLRTLSTSLAAQRGSALPWLAQVTTSGAPDSGNEMEKTLYEVLQAQKGGQGAREKVIKDVKEELSRRRRGVAGRVEEVLKRGERN